MKTLFTSIFVLFSFSTFFAQEIYWHEKFTFPKIGTNFQAIGKEGNKLVGLFNKSIYESSDDGKSWQLRYVNDSKFTFLGKPFKSRGEIFYVLEYVFNTGNAVRDLEVRIMSSKSESPKIIDEFHNHQYSFTHFTHPIKCSNERIYISRWTSARSPAAVNKQGFMNFYLEEEPNGKELEGSYIGYDGSHVFIGYDSVRVFNSYWQYQKLAAFALPNSTTSADKFYKVNEGKFYEIDNNGEFAIIDLKTSGLSTGNLQLNIDDIEINNNQLFFQNSEGLFKATDSELTNLDTIFLSEKYDLTLSSYHHDTGSVYYGVFNCGRMGKTIDNGQTWEFWLPQGATSHPLTVDLGFKDSIFLQSYCFGGFYLNCENELIETSESAGKSIYESSDTVLLIKGSQLLFSHDNGDSWNSIFKNNQNLIGGTILNNSIVVHDTLMYYSKDFGSSWDTISFSIVDKIDKFSDNLIVESDGVLYKSSDFTNFEEISDSENNQSWGATSEGLWKFRDYYFYLKSSLDSDWEIDSFIFGAPPGAQFHWNSYLRTSTQDSLIFVNIGWYVNTVPQGYYSYIQWVSRDGGISWKGVYPIGQGQFYRFEFSENFLFGYSHEKLYQARISDLLLGTLPMIENTVYFCEHSSIQIGNQTFSGPQTVMLDLGCDSLVLTRIVQVEDYFHTIDTLVNEGDLVEGFSMLNDTTFGVIHQSVHACDSLVIYRVTVDRSSSISDSVEKNNVQIFPNPLNSETELNIVFSEGHRKENVEIKIFDSLRKTIAFKESMFNQNQFKLKLPAMHSGVYFIQISEIGKKPILKKLMIFKE